MLRRRYQSGCHTCRRRLLRHRDYGYSRISPLVSIVWLTVTFVKALRRQNACDTHGGGASGCPDGCKSSAVACAGPDCNGANPCISEEVREGAPVFAFLNTPEVVLVVVLVMILAAYAAGVFLAHHRRIAASRIFVTSARVVSTAHAAASRQKRHRTELPPSVQTVMLGGDLEEHTVIQQCRAELHHPVPGMIPRGDEEKQAMELWASKHSKLGTHAPE